eukprot:TRINITY_DN6311_c2_g1_i1.p1 TRINITY_DN6311_c2_g1~~TRINITY_DN6311_c2_g1_i1.p1  ORF type:complete len:1018 (+),score=405.05 TRINITY_DN6311_c2_g1_i1:56-3055(+)
MRAGAVPTVWERLSASPVARRSGAAPAAVSRREMVRGPSPLPSPRPRHSDPSPSVRTPAPARRSRSPAVRDNNVRRGRSRSGGPGGRAALSPTPAARAASPGARARRHSPGRRPQPARPSPAQLISSMDQGAARLSRPVGRRREALTRASSWNSADAVAQVLRGDGRRPAAPVAVSRDGSVGSVREGSASASTERGRADVTPPAAPPAPAPALAPGLGPGGRRRPNVAAASLAELSREQPVRQPSPEAAVMQERYYVERMPTSLRRERTASVGRERGGGDAEQVQAGDPYLTIQHDANRVMERVARLLNSVAQGRRNPPQPQQHGFQSPYLSARTPANPLLARAEIRPLPQQVRQRPARSPATPSVVARPPPPDGRQERPAHASPFTLTPPQVGRPAVGMVRGGRAGVDHIGAARQLAGQISAMVGREASDVSMDTSQSTLQPQAVKRLDYSAADASADSSALDLSANAATQHLHSLLAASAAGQSSPPRDPPPPERPLVVPVPGGAIGVQAVLQSARAADAEFERRRATVGVGGVAGSAGWANGGQMDAAALQRMLRNSADDSGAMRRSPQPPSDSSSPSPRREPAATTPIAAAATPVTPVAATAVAAATPGAASASAASASASADTAEKILRKIADSSVSMISADTAPVSAGSFADLIAAPVAQLPAEPSPLPTHLIGLSPGLPPPGTSPQEESQPRSCSVRTASPPRAPEESSPRPRKGSPAALSRFNDERAALGREGSPNARSAAGSLLQRSPPTSLPPPPLDAARHSPARSPTPPSAAGGSPAAASPEAESAGSPASSPTSDATRAARLFAAEAQWLRDAAQMWHDSVAALPQVADGLDQVSADVAAMVLAAARDGHRGAGRKVPDSEFAKLLGDCVAEAVALQRDREEQSRLLPSNRTYGRMRLRRLEDQMRPKRTSGRELGAAVVRQCGLWAAAEAGTALTAEAAAVSEAAHRMRSWRLTSPALREEVVDRWVELLVDDLLTDTARHLDGAP